MITKRFTTKNTKYRNVRNQKITLKADLKRYILSWALKAIEVFIVLRNKAVSFRGSEQPLKRLCPPSFSVWNKEQTKGPTHMILEFSRESKVSKFPRYTQGFT